MPDRPSESNRENITLAIATAAGQLRHCLEEIDTLYDAVSTIAQRAWGDSPPAAEVRELQRFDHLRQRVDGLTEALGLVEAEMRGQGSGDLRRTLASLPLGALAQAFAAAYDLPAPKPSEDDEFELF
ncbi:MAG: hypothetical protein HQL39_14815 [Alphaproteobacteria bacterium]|nr:hypothetical protein [Alphaproteobacteria bacterium]